MKPILLMLVSALGLTVALPFGPRPGLPQILAHNRSWIQSNANEGEENVVVAPDLARPGLEC